VPAMAPDKSVIMTKVMAFNSLFLAIRKNTHI
jgi:hypothetical protein